jgi:hypothetical protein
MVVLQTLLISPLQIVDQLVFDEQNRAAASTIQKLGTSTDRSSSSSCWLRFQVFWRKNFWRQTGKRLNDVPFEILFEGQVSNKRFK